MPDLDDGESTKVKGSGSSVYSIRNVGGVYSCSCPAWRNQSIAVEKRTCKHLRRLRGDEAEDTRVGSTLERKAIAKSESTTSASDDAAPPLLLAHTWENDVDLTGWWMSEKLDGVRAWWDGKQFISRLGNRYFAPDWFVEKLPDVPLDGELWGGRKLFQRTVSIVRRQDKNDLWKEISYLVFDAPKLDAPFEARLDFIRDTLADGRSPHARYHTHEHCRGVAHLREELARVEALGGEGLMLRKPGSRYEAGRSSTLLKVKTFHDAEARVIGYVAGAGRHKGRTGALQVEMPDGTRFAVGTGLSDAERDHPPAIGALITYRYQELSDGGVPRFPSFLRIREDDTPMPAMLVKPAAARVPTRTPVFDPATIRRFECTDESGAKFWEVARSGASYRMSFGTIGATAQQRSFTRGSDEAAAREVEILIREKVAKGYREV